MPLQVWWTIFGWPPSRRASTEAAVPLPSGAGNVANCLALISQAYPTD